MDIRELIEQCRRQQQQLPGQLEISNETGMWRWVNREWATAEEALEEWRSRTVEDWGVGTWVDA